MPTRVVPDRPPSTAAPTKRRANGGISAFEYVFPALRGVQAQREFYVTMCPLRLIPRLFLWDEEELLPELRAQRILNKARVPEMARYMVDNRGGYVFSALTASVDADVTFEALATGGPEERIGVLTIPMSARFVINDGQHRRAAIVQALRECPELGDESIAVVLFMDIGLQRCQQMFADLNRYAVRPSTSLSVLYDHRNELSRITRQVVFCSPTLSDLVDTEKTNLSTRSRKLFTLSALNTCVRSLLDGFGQLEINERASLARDFWERVAARFPEWRLVKDGKISAGEVRRDFVHGHGIALHALGKVGNSILRVSCDPADWDRYLAKLEEIDWSRSNALLWEGRAMVGGKVSKSSGHVILTTNAIRTALGLPLSIDEQRAEAAFNRGES